MAIEQIKMPQLGESVHEGTIIKWFVSAGDRVKKYDPLAEVMTDKVTAEIPSSFNGMIKEISAKEGDTVRIGDQICSIEVEGENEYLDVPSNITPAHDDSQGAGKKLMNQGQPKRRYSPAVLKLSQEYGIDLTRVKGTGIGGRITRKDLLKWINEGNNPTKHHQNELPKKILDEQNITEVIPGNQKPAFFQNQQPSPAAGYQDTKIPVTGVRKAIALNMLRSKQEIPHAWTMVEVDVTNLVSYRESIKEEFKKKEGFSLTYFPFFVKACAQALKEFPQLNSTWAGENIIQKKEINISIAVATEDALYVPVIKAADEKTIKGIAREITELALKIRNGKIAMEDMEGGTFTVNNTGSFGSVQSMGIINYPQAAILQVESIVKRPIVMNNGMIAVRDMVNLCLSLDHRVLDGLVCGRFLQRVKSILENMTKDNTPIY